MARPQPKPVTHRGMRDESLPRTSNLVSTSRLKSAEPSSEEAIGDSLASVLAELDELERVAPSKLDDEPFAPSSSSVSLSPLADKLEPSARPAASERVDPTASPGYKSARRIPRMPGSRISHAVPPLPSLKPAPRASKAPAVPPPVTTPQEVIVPRDPPVDVGVVAERPARRGLLAGGAVLVLVLVGGVSWYVITHTPTLTHLVP